VRSKLVQLVLGGWTNTVLAGLLGIYVARRLGPESRGIMAMATDSAALLAMFLGLSVAQAAGYFARARQGASRRILAIGDRLSVAAALFAALMLGLGSAVFSQLFLDGYPLDWRLVALMVVLTGASLSFGLLNAVRVARGETRRVTVGNTAGTLVAIGVTVTLLQVDRTNVHGAVLGAAVGLVVSCALLRPSAVEATPPAPLSLRELFGFGLRVHPGTLASVAFKRLDLFFVAYYLDPVSVGWYSVGLALRELVMTVARSTTGLVSGELADPKARADGTAKQAFRRGIQINAAFPALAFVGSLVLFPLLIPLVFGAPYAGAVAPAILLIASAIPLSVGVLVAATTSALGAPMSMSAGNVLSSLLGLAVLWYGTWRFGLRGAAGAAIVTNLSMLAIHSWILRGPWRRVVT
jgi:PST family polysaccharide transporter